MNEKNIKIYQEYKSLPEGKGLVVGLCKRNKISRSRLYKIVKQVEEGNPKACLKCVEYAKLECMWTHMYELRFNALPKNRLKSSVKALKTLIREMHDGGKGMSAYMIAKFTKMHISTIKHHLEK